MSTLATHVAVVDDDVSVCKALTRLLSASSFDVTTFSSAREFLKSLKSRKPDCLVADLHMPDLTGFDLQRHLNRAGIAIPTIIITAFNEPGLRERCQSAGAIAFLLKPFDGTELLDIVHTATKKIENRV